MKIRFSGFGGQGIILCGYIFGQAGMIEGKNSIQTQSYGSASRGGLTRSDVSIEEGEIHDLIYDDFDVVVTLSQQSYDQFHTLLAPGATLFYESDLVLLGDDAPERAFGIPATDIAFKKFGRKIMANMVMMGFVNALSGVLDRDALVAAIRQNVPEGTEKTNEAAYEEGVRLAGEVGAG